MKKLPFKLLYNTASAKIIADYLHDVSPLFVPNLTEEVNIWKYSQKIRYHAQTLELWEQNKLIGLIAGYLNLDEQFLFITHFSIKKNYQSCHNGEFLFCQFINHWKFIKEVRLEVSYNNIHALNLYTKLGFKISEYRTSKYYMILSR